MTPMPNTLADLLAGDAIPRDETRGLDAIAGLLGELDPILVLLADRQGNLLAANVFGPETAMPQAAALVRELAHRLSDRAHCTFRQTDEPESPTVFGFRLSADGHAGILGGIVRGSGLAAQELKRLGPAAVACGALALEVFRLREENVAMDTRVRHLQAEQSTLKVLHADAMNAVLEEREQRLREQGDYAVHLQKEVERRSIDLQTALNDAKQAYKAKSEFLANMSHEIRTPMTAILGFADMLRNEAVASGAPQQRLAAVNSILRNGEFLLQLINDILDLSKIEFGRLCLDENLCSPVQIVADVQALMQVRADAKSLPLRVEYPGVVPETIRSDPGRLRQILVNLVGNALKFNYAGEVRLVTQFLHGADGKPVIQFEIIDTGIGMTPEQLGKLFQPFTQADTSMTREFGGSGLGLTISKRLTDMLGGAISVESELGHGSTFRVQIPTGPLEGVKLFTPSANAPGAPAAGAEPAPLVPSLGPPPCRILVAEDSPDTQRLLQFLLRKAGAEVTVAQNGQSAYELAVQAMESGQCFHIILMDMQMPILDGYEATRRLRKQGYTAPIIALTAHAMRGDREQCLAAGCDDYATKPIRRDGLLSLVAGYIGPPHMDTSRMPADAAS
jgi:signal transduction histidine kinase/ActR/RegA family two-component response regulator